MKNPTKKTDIETADFLWKVIQRYDYYIGTTNAKAALIVAFDTFVFGGIVLKWQDLLPFFGAHYKAAILASCLLFIAALASLVSLWTIFLVISPFLKSPRSPTKYHSAVFFGHVSEHKSADDYLGCVRDLDEETLSRDLCAQAHVLSQGLRDKFHSTKISVRAILFGQLPALVLMVLVKLYTLLSDILEKGVQR
jgi:hypothetical protein